MSNELQRANEAKASIAPMLSVRNGARAIEFYKAAFGAQELFRVENDKGEAAGIFTICSVLSPIGSPRSIA
jgi:hypothetical protein